jgi:hypothetical protein
MIAGTYTVLAGGGAAGDEPLGPDRVAFRSAAEAVRAALALDGGAGLHAGELAEGAGPDARTAVLAQRLATLAGDGVLASAVVRELAGEELRFGPGRDVTLPGLAGRMVVHDVPRGERRPLRVVIADDAALIRDGVAAIGQIFLELGLRDAEGEGRRVAAVLAYLKAT